MSDTTMARPGGPGALSHLRVLDLSRVLAGPWCSQNLADMGADVIKVERPGAGDDTRGWGPPWVEGAQAGTGADSTYYAAANRGKKSITMDISRPEGQEMIRKLAEDDAKFNLALSLHAANDTKRDRIMPINEQNNLAELKDALRFYTRSTKRPVTFEYILLRGFNDSLADAQELVRYASDVHAKVNLIEYNPIDGGEFGRTESEDAVAFMRYLENKGIVARIRRSRGRDIDAACGQLANKNEPALKDGERLMK